MKFRIVGAVAATLVVTLTACGNQDEEASKAISDAWVKEDAAGALDLSRAEADCLGEGWVDKIGVDQLKEYGILTDDMKAKADMGSVEMSQDDAEAAADVAMDCADVMGNLDKAMDDAVGSLPDEVKSCIDEKLNEQVVHDFLVKAFRGDPDGGQQDLMATLQECMSA